MKKIFLVFVMVLACATMSAQDKDYKVLRQGRRTVFVNQVTEPNTVYEIRHSYDLGGKNVTIPDGCELRFAGGVIYNGTITGQNTIIKAEPTIVFSGIVLDGEWLVSDVYPEWFGASGDGKHDDSVPMQNALDCAAISAGRKVSLLGKSYLINSQLDVPDAVEIGGVYSKNDTSLDNASIIVCTNSAINNPADGLFRVGASVYIHDLKFWYPDQPGFDSESNVIPYAPSILVKKNSDYVTLDRLAFAGSYIGIRAEFHKNLTVSSCVGFCFKYGLLDEASHDIDRISDCHFNFNYLWQNSGYSSIHPWPNGAYSLYRYAFQNESAAFKIGQCDWIVLSNCFAYGYNTGFAVGSSSVHNYNLNIIGGGADSCKNGVALVNCHYAHITDLTITHGDVWGSSEAVKVADRRGAGISMLDCEDIKLENVTHQFSRGNTLVINNSSRVLVSNCSYRATSFNTNEDWAVLAMGKSSFSFSNCVFSGWGTVNNSVEGGGLGCIAVVYDNKGMVTGSVDNCRFDYCATLCVIEGGTSEASNTHYLKQSNNTICNLMNPRAMVRMRNADVNYGSSAKRKLLSGQSGVWSSMADGEYWDTDLKKTVYWNGTSWVDATGKRL